MKIVFWGTYDLGKPRNRILLRGLRENGVEVIECQKHVWDGVEDKSRVSSKRWQLWHCLRWLAAYPRLLWRYLCLPRHDLIIVGYVGQIDVLLIRPLAWLRRTPVVWDTYLSLHDTVVSDRALIGPRHPLALLLFAWEWLALRAADRLLVDTDAHARFFVERFGIKQCRIQRVFIGVEPDVFYPSLPENRQDSGESPYRVLFYGQFIPLHGLETIVRAAQLCEQDDILWEIVGKGQETERFRALLDRIGPLNLSWTPWVPYRDLNELIGNADLCLGIFGTSDKASRVIPNKVYQALAAGRALITADSPAIRELLEDGPGIALVPPGDSEALAAAVRDMRARCPDAAQAQLATFRPLITPEAIGRELVSGLKDMAAGRCVEVCS